MKKSVFLLFVSSLFVLSGCENVNPTPTPKPDKVERQLSCVDLKANNYVVGDVFYNFINNGGLVAKVVYTDNSSRTLEKDEFTCKIVDKDNINYDSHSVFATVGSYDVTISRGSLRDYTYTIKVDKSSEPKSIVSIEASGYTSSVYQGDYYTFDGKVTAKYSDGTSKDVTSSAEIGLISTMNLGEQSLLIKYQEDGKQVSTSIKITVKEKETPAPTLTEITVSDYTNHVYKDETYNFDGKVTAKYSDGTSKDVTSSADIDPISTSTLGTKTGNVSYTEGTVTKTATYSVTVEEKGPEYETITVEEAVKIIDGQGVNEISEKEYYVRGIATNVELDANGFNGAFLNSNLKFRSVKGNGVASTVDEIEGKEVVIFGYLENYNSIYQIPYLPVYASPTGQKYNPKLIEVKSGGEEETIDVTNVSISPVSKTIEVGKSSTLIPTVLPQNATDKSLTWTSSAPGVCSVSNSGEITGVSVGTAVITATSNNNIKATSNVTVKETETPIEGDTFEIAFNHFESDGQSELTTTTIKDQVSSGLDYISSFTSVKKAYKGMEGIKIGSNTGSGSISFDTISSFASLECREIVLDVSVSGTRSKTVNLFVNDSQVGSGSSADGKITIKLNTLTKVNSVKVSTSGRAYLSKITFVCGEEKPIPVTAISIPSSKEISTGNSETLTVAYTPSNANTGKVITWTTNNPAVATVLDGVIKGVSPGNATITATSEGGLTAKCTVTVSNIAVTGVTLSSTSETLAIGSTKQLSATVSPSNATNKSVTWSSSSSGVASVDSTGLVTANAVGNTTITVKTADGNKTATCSVTVSETKKDAWTILIYMCGADLESGSGLATGDIKEILSVANQPDDVNIVIETGGAKSWSLSSSYIDGATRIDPSKLSRWHVANKKLVLDTTLSYASMGESSTLQSFVEYGIKEYPAEKTGVIFWNHGGAMYGCCYDEKKNDDSLVNSEMKSAFSKALANTGTSKLEFVGYDTCLTQVQDIAEFNSNYFNYMIASEEAEAGEGWDYDTWVDDLYAKKSTDTILKAIVDGFIKDNGGASSYYSDQTLSYLDLTKMSAYKSAFESFATALKNQLSSKSVSKSTFTTWMANNVKAFAVDNDDSEKYYCLFDVKDMLNKLSSSSSYNPGSSYITAVNNAFSNLVKYSVAQNGAGNAYGLGCIYSQSSSYSYYIKDAYTSSETNFTNWLSFLKSYSYLG